MICRVWECWALGSHELLRTRTRVPMNQVGIEREIALEFLKKRVLRVREVGIGFFQLELWVCLGTKTGRSQPPLPT